MLVALTGSLSMIFVDMTVTAVAGPKIGDALGLDDTGIAWIANAYMLALAALMAIGGRMGDVLGKRTAFLCGVSVFAIASALCGAASDPVVLIGGRVLQGVGACLMQPASAALVIESFAPGERGKAMGIYIGISMSFFAIGPVLGGVLSEYAGWRSVFFINLPIAVAAIVLVWIARPPNHRSADRRIDIPSALLLVSGLPLAVYALQEGAKMDAHAGPHTGVAMKLLEPGYLAMLGVGLALTALFVVRQIHAARPLVRVALFTEPRIRANVLLVGIMQFAMASLVVEGSIYAQKVLGYAPSKAGMSLMPMLVPVIFVARQAGKMYDRHGVRPLARGGTAAAAAGLAVWGLGSMASSYPVIAAGMALLGLGIAFIMSPANTDTLSGVADEMRGQVSGLLQTIRQVGGAVGIAFAAAVTGFATALGADLAHAIGASILAGAAVAAMGVVVALRMPHSPPPGASQARATLPE